MRERARAALGWLFFIVPLAAVAAEVTRTLDGSTRFWWSCAAVQVLAWVGWGASSLKSLAGWNEGTLRRLEIMQGMIVSGLAANIAYYGGYYGLLSWKIDLPEILCFISAALAGFGGAKYVSALVDALITSAQTILARGSGGTK